MNLRPYQEASVKAILREFEERCSTLVVLPTGCGKTVVFASLIKEQMDKGRCMVLAHRDELIHQAADKIKAVTGHQPEIEMAGSWADLHMFSRSRVVVSSIQTQIAGQSGAGRMTRFNPSDFSTLIIDEAHHAAADTYQRVIAHYRKNPDLRVLGVTATADRGDGVGLGETFESVAYKYDLPDAVRDGWLVPIRQRMVHVPDLDLSAVGTTAGDLNGRQLGEIVEMEPVLMAMAGPTLEIACGLAKGTLKQMLDDRTIDSLPGAVERIRKTVVFCATVKQADRFAEILNRFIPGIASWVSGETEDSLRRETFAAFRTGKIRFLANVGICTEGWDEPTVEVVAVARPTKSRALYAQIVGRGTRTLPGTVDGLESPDQRREAINGSAKSFVEVLDFRGNSGRHKLVSTADLLAGKAGADVIERARGRAKEESAVDMLDELENAKRAIEQEHAESERKKQLAAEREAKRQAEAEERRRVRAAVDYQVETVDPFTYGPTHASVYSVPASRELATERQIRLLGRFGVDGRSLTKRQASAVIAKKLNEVKGRREPQYAAVTKTLVDNIDWIETY